MTERSERRPTFAQIKTILASGQDAGRNALQLGQQRMAGQAFAYAEEHGNPATTADIDDIVEAAIRAHVKLARAEGAAAGLATTTAEGGVIIESVGFTIVLASINVADLTALAWIQLRMVLIIAALHGHDPKSPTRLREFMSLQGATPAAGAGPMTRTAADATQRVFTRLLKRLLRGPALAATKSMFRTVGINFSRAGLIRQLPLVNIPANAVVNDMITRRLGAKAKEFYASLPTTMSARAA